MKISKGTIVLIVVLAVLVAMGIKNSKKEKSLNEKILKEVTLVADGKVQSGNNGKLVLAAGKINFEGDIQFEELDKPIKSFKVIRTVKDFVEYEKDGEKHYDWQERTQAKSTWGALLDQVYSTQKTITPTIGEFTLDSKGLELVNASSYYETDNLIAGLKWNGMEYTNMGRDDAEPGDVSITYDYFDCEKNEYLTILAKQSGNTFVPYTFDKEDVYRVFNGKIDSMEKLTTELDVQVQKSNRGRIALYVLIVLVALLLMYNNAKTLKQKKAEN